MSVTIRFSLAAAAAVLALAAAAPARAEGEAAFAAPPLTGSGFGAAGQIVISMGATTDEHVFFHDSGGAWQLQLSPSLDYFIAPRISVGGVIGYRHDSGGGTNADGTDRILLGPRAGYDIDINDRFGFWPLAGLFFERTSANHGSTTNTLARHLRAVPVPRRAALLRGAGPVVPAQPSGPELQRVRPRLAHRRLVLAPRRH